MQILRQLLGDAFFAGRKPNNEKSKIQTQEAFDIWIEENKFLFKDIKCIREVKIGEVKEVSVLKLDRNFHVYVHGDKQLLEIGEDETGKFIKLKFNEMHK